jgi:rubredoxin-NAD+ reductase
MIVIIGSGLSGQLVLRGLRDKGYVGKITMISEHIADFYSKPSLSNLVKQNKQAHDLIQMSESEIAEKYDVSILSQQSVTSIDRENKIVYVDKKEVPYKQLVLATGAVPKEFDILANDKRIFRVNDLWAYDRFSKKLNKNTRLVILGGGLIGCEFANDLMSQVGSIAVLEASSSLMSQMVPKEIGQGLKQQLETIGVQVHTSSPLEKIEEKSDALKLYCQDQVLEADIVLAAVGMVTNTKLAKEAGLDVEQGVLINQYAQTSDPDIYAIGDCTQSQWGVRYYVAPLKLTAEVVVSQLMAGDLFLQFPALPVMVKTPVYPICFCIKAPPDRWEVEQQDGGVKALGYLENTMVAFALTGKYMPQRVQLKQQL